MTTERLTRIRVAVFREQQRIKRAPVEKVDRAADVFNRDIDQVKALVMIHQGMERGKLSPQEGAELSLIASRYSEAALAERIVLYQCLLELSGRDMSDLRPTIIH